MYKSILLPTDGTEFCERAIQHGIDLAKLVQAKIVGVTVTQPLHSAVPRSLIPKNLAGDHSLRDGQTRRPETCHHRKARTGSWGAGRNCP